MDISFLDDYQFDRAMVYLVTSIPGAHMGSQLEKYGHLRMRSLLSRFSWNKEVLKVPTDIQTSNIGKLDKEFLKEVTASLHINSENETMLNIRIIFPSISYMENSPCKEHGWYFYWTYQEKDADIFLRDILDPRFPGLLLHSKIYRQCTPQGTGWVYAGGHNFSRAAWGWTTRSGKVINLKNFEIGVLFVAPDENSYWSPIIQKIFFPFPWEPLPYKEIDRPWVPPDFERKGERKGSNSTSFKLNYCSSCGCSNDNGKLQCNSCWQSKQPLSKFCAACGCVTGMSRAVLCSDCYRKKDGPKLCVSCKKPHFSGKPKCYKCFKESIDQ